MSRTWCESTPRGGSRSCAAASTPWFTGGRLRLVTMRPAWTPDDHASILGDFEAGARGLYWASQVAIGHDSALRVRVVGSKGAIAWAQEDPNHLAFSQLGKPSELLSRGRD